MIKILLRRNVKKLGLIGEVVEVKDGYARNYLIPHGLAMEPTEGNLKAIEDERLAYLAELAKEREVLVQRAKVLADKEFTVTARANEEGHLYGSVGTAQIAALISEAGHVVDSENILLDEPIRKLDKYDVVVEFDEGISATVILWVVPPHDNDVDEDEDATGSASLLEDIPEPAPAPAPAEEQTDETPDDAAETPADDAAEAADEDKTDN